MRVVLLNIGCCLLLCACAIGPDYMRPPVPESAAFKEAGPQIPDVVVTKAMREAATLWQPAAVGLDGLPSAPVSLHNDGAWWTALGDSVLNELMERLEKANQDIALAAARYRQAKAQAGAAQSNLFPFVDAGASASRGRSVTSSGSKLSDAFAGDLSVSWELDLWGAVRRSVEAADATALASFADGAGVRLSMQTECLLAYLNVRISDALLDLYAKTIEGYEKALTMTMNQYRAGIVTKADVAQAQTQLAASKAQMIDLELTRRQYEHALATLLGYLPSQFTLQAVPMSLILPHVPETLPSSLVERRPDILAAEQRVAAANAQVGIATAAFFPRLTFNLLRGFQSNAWDTWFTAPQRVWSVGPSLALSLFDGGQRLFASRTAEAAYDATVIQYRQSVLTAFQEVENALAAVRLLHEEAAMQAISVASSREAVRLAMAQYRAGTADYLLVVTMQATSLLQERNYTSLLGRQWQAAVMLIKALGGDWKGML